MTKINVWAKLEKIWKGMIVKGWPHSLEDTINQLAFDHLYLALTSAFLKNADIKIPSK